VGRIAAVDGDPQLVLEVRRTPERDGGSSHLVVDVDEALEGLTLGAGGGTEEGERGSHLFGFTSVCWGSSWLSVCRSRLGSLFPVTAACGDDESEDRHEGQQSRPSPHVFLLLAVLCRNGPAHVPVPARAGQLKALSDITSERERASSDESPLTSASGAGSASRDAAPALHRLRAGTARSWQPAPP